MDSQQKALWAVVREETGRGKDRFKISELFADGNDGSRTDSGPPGGKRGTRQRGGKREREVYLAQVTEEERALGEGAGGLSIIFSERRRRGDEKATS